MAAVCVTDRLVGARRALAAAGRDPDSLTVIETDGLFIAAGRRAGEILTALPRRRRPTAAFCANDLVALGLLQHVAQLGIDVPGELAIVGYDDIEFAGAAAVPLTSIHQPRHELGATAAELLLAEVGRDRPARPRTGRVRADARGPNVVDDASASLRRPLTRRHSRGAARGRLVRGPTIRFMTEEQLTPTVAAELRDEAQGLLDATVALRRTCTSGRRSATTCRSPASTVLAALEGLPLDITAARDRRAASPRCSTAAKPGPTILLRGDMDALPMPEDTGLDFASQVDGHDARLRPRHAHGDARRRGPAAQRRAATSCAGRVLFMFQPGEEGHHGARYMLEEGLLDVPALADGTASPVTGGVRPAHHLVAADRVRQHPAAARSWRRPTGCSSRSPAAAATPASRTGRSTRSRSPARSCRRCRR